MEQVDSAHVRLDPAGVPLAEYGITEAPCESDDHLATVVTGDHAYHAFCGGEEGRISIYVMAPDSAFIDQDQASPLGAFLSLTPDDVAVPTRLAGAEELPSGRTLTDDVVAFVDPNAQVSLFRNNSCSSASFFETNHCTIYEDWADDVPPGTPSMSWCTTTLLSGDAQRTGTTQLGDVPRVGRIRVAACDDEVVVRRYYRNPFNSDWWNAGNVTVQPGHIYARTISNTGATWCGNPDPFGNPCENARDLRFRVEPEPGGSYRYTGGYTGFTPIP